MLCILDLCQRIMNYDDDSDDTEDALDTHSVSEDDDEDSDDMEDALYTHSVSEDDDKDR